MHRRRSLLTVLAASGTLVLAGSWQVGALVPDLPLLDDDPTTTTTQPSSQATTTTTQPPERGRSLLRLPGQRRPPPQPTQPQPPAQPPPVSVQPGAPAPSTPAVEPDADGTAPSDAGPFPPGLKALMNSIQRTPGNNTGALLAALAPLADFSISPQEAALVGMGRFPVAGYATYTHDWWLPRFGPGWRLHMGTDIFAAHGTPVRSPANGTVRLSNGGLGGLATYVQEADGTFYYLAHLAGYPEGLANGQQVHVGQVVGFVGDTGNARGGSPHLHFEIHPQGGPAVDPKAHLDQWLAQAMAQIPALIEHYRAQQPQILAATGLTRRLSDGSMGAFPKVDSPPRAQLLWASSASPAGGALWLAEVEAADAAATIDWEVRSRRHLARSLAWEEAERTVRTLLSPLTPTPLTGMFLRAPEPSWTPNDSETPPPG